jgi:threonine/homoserine/homoserine lactone efflux protein
MYLAALLFRGASLPLQAAASVRDPVVSQWKSFVLGLVTQLSNPKTAIVYASIFAALMPDSPPVPGAPAIIGLIFAIESGWYAIVAIAFSSDTTRNRYLQYKRWIDRAAGGVMGLLAAKLIWDTRA